MFIVKANRSTRPKNFFLQVFKHTFDVVHDYACYALMAIGAIALSVRFLTFGNGEITCVILGRFL